MATDLAHHIQGIPLVDTHEHLQKEGDWVENGPDILQDLFGNYVAADLHTAGASPEAMQRLMRINEPYSYANPSTGVTPELMNPSGDDIKSRFEDIREAWEASQFTGYGEGVRLKKLQAKVSQPHKKYFRNYGVRVSDIGCCATWLTWIMSKLTTSAGLACRIALDRTFSCTICRGRDSVRDVLIPIKSPPKPVLR